MSFCYHHPVLPARWYCEHCRKDFCDQCVRAPNTEEGYPLCYGCQQELSYQPNKADVIPFWNRLSDFFRYPFQGQALIMLSVSLVSALLPDSWIGLIIALLLFLLQLQYGYQVIDTVAHGKMVAPSVADILSGERFGLVFKQFLAIIAMVVLVMLVGHFLHPILAVVLALFFIASLPVSMIMLAMEGDLAAALNPLNLAGMIVRIGWAYGLVYFYMILMSLCSASTSQLLMDLLGPTVGQTAGAISGFYFMLVMFALLGYLVHQYRFELNLGATKQDLRLRRMANQADPNIHMHLHNGQYGSALELMEKSCRDQRGQLSTLERYFKILAFTGDYERLNRGGGGLLAQLAEYNQLAMLTRILRQIWQQQPEFEFSGEQALELGAYLREQQEIELAVRMIKRQYKIVRNAKTRNRLLELFAEIAEEHLRKPELAQQLLKLKGQVIPDLDASAGMQMAPKPE
ncbi:hypothetical protein [Gynuella sunshinyii]|uniref:B box-type domain-containing protein n=1 Tax=Gynuella sunshinyii YC6258 TaxID=1445510 RepID=A0A0C5UXN9_9GAMM|nr:hypothetical protein [Gynuella sunshinyii]AJQ92075.1 hypothetical Protein YC6258_00019 [Gynuella sunshinyii YC6258]